MCSLDTNPVYAYVRTYHSILSSYPGRLMTRVVRNPGATGSNPPMPFRRVLPTDVAFPGKYTNLSLGCSPAGHQC